MPLAPLSRFLFQLVWQKQEHYKTVEHCQSDMIEAEFTFFFSLSALRFDARASSASFCFSRFSCMQQVSLKHSEVIARNAFESQDFHEW